jgi:hypothetical protein
LTAANSKLGRKPKLDLAQLAAKAITWPFQWHVAKIRQQLAQKHQIQVSYTTLRRFMITLVLSSNKG